METSDSIKRERVPRNEGVIILLMIIAVASVQKLAAYWEGRGAGRN